MTTDGTRQVTAAALERMRDELDHLLRVERPRALRELEESLTDSINVSESGAYLTAMQNRERVAANIAALEDRISRCVVVEAADDGTASIGTCVELDFGDGDCSVFVLGDQCDGAEALSPGSPMGAAVLGHVAGDEVRWSAPVGELSATVVRVFLPGAA